MNVPSTFKANDGDDKEEDNVVTMADVLQEENELEEDANAVLGGADDKMCTYSKGYVYRQPLYACATCGPPEKDKPAGICLACSYHCHEGHELIELYTKRNFRCDCGNSCFPSAKCNLEPVKDDINSKNTYNQNFMGVYCICKRPYPDPEDPVEDEMIQCILCEDWFHKRHLDAKVPEDFGEMICQVCMANHLFLWKYSGLCVKPKESGDESLNVSVTDTSTKGCEETRGEEETNKSKLEDCYLKSSTLEVGTGSTFWPENWRKSLCKCQECIDLYESEKVSFLLNENDTVQFYENTNKQLAKESQYERGLKALSSLNRIEQVEVIEDPLIDDQDKGPKKHYFVCQTNDCYRDSQSGYNQMKSELLNYLQKFAENKKVVREEDIREFFTQMEARKKHKVEIPHYCH